MVKVSIIGTAGRDKSQKYTKELFDKMLHIAKYVLANMKDITLVSGGAAWADHIAVKLYLEGYVKDLELHLPCNWDNNQYLDNGKYYWKDNPGKTANSYHFNFSKTIGCNTLNEITLAINKGARIQVHDGFHARNTEVANSEFLLAFTWSQENQPPDGGTLDTWNKSNAQKIHISLHQL